MDDGRRNNDDDGCLVLDGEGGNTGEVLALQKLQGSSTSSRDVRDLVFLAPLGDSGGSVTASDNRDGTLKRMCHKRKYRISKGSQRYTSWLAY